MTDSKPVPSSGIGPVHAMFFGSGAASLMCEVAWFKQLGLVLGHNTVTASIVIACFFGGLATGSLLVGGASDRWDRPLRRYGLLELALAVASLGTTLVLWKWSLWIGLFRPWMSLDSGTALPVKTFLALVIMLPATVLMGATLPVLSRYLVRARSDLAEQVGLLYGLNTLGAVVGSSVMGMWLIGALGVVESAAIASGLYALIGVGALWLSRDEVELVPEVQREQEPSELPPELVRSASILVAVFGASGFLAIAYEVLWFRLLTYFAANTIYTFSAMLSTYLLGLVLGSLICAKWVARHKDSLLASFARVQLGIALAAMVSLGFAGQGRKILELLGYSPLQPSGVLSLSAGVAVVLLVPTTLIGMSFPLASELTIHRLSRVGSRVGLLYSLNTYAGVVGSLTASLLLLPFLGAQWAFTLIVFGNLALFGVLWVTQPDLGGTQGLKREGILVTVACVVLAVGMGPNYLNGQLRDAFPGEKLVFEETADATFLVLEHEPEHTDAYQQLVVNGTSYANNILEGRRYMALLAHLPMLVHPEPEDAVVICVGTGTTIGAASLHDRTKRLWSVDVTRHVFDYAPHFVPRNHSFYENPKVRPVLSDGRHFLQVTDQTFDVLTFEPPPPIETGVVNLYSREFYRIGDQRVKEGGVVAQWIPFHQGFEEIHRMLIRTMMEVYPHVALFVSNRNEGIILGTHHPLRIDYAALATRMAEPDIAEDLHSVGVDSPEDLLAMFVASDDDLRAFVGDAAVVTDDHPLVEHFFRYPNTPFDIADALAHRTPVDAILAGPLPDPQRYAESQAWTNLMWEADRPGIDRDYDRRVELLEQAQEHAPDNVYLAYRKKAIRALEQETTRAAK